MGVNGPLPPLPGKGLASVTKWRWSQNGGRRRKEKRKKGEKGKKERGAIDIEENLITKRRRKEEGSFFEHSCATVTRDGQNDQGSRGLGRPHIKWAKN